MRGALDLASETNRISTLIVTLELEDKCRWIM